MRSRQFRRQRNEHVDVVGLAERARRHEYADAGLVQRIFELAQPVRRVDVHKDGADLGGRVLRDDPLGGVPAPDADAIATRDAERQQSARGAIDLLDQLRVRVTEILVTGDQRIAPAESRRDPIERCANRLAEKRDHTGAVDVGGRHTRVMDLVHYYT